MIIIYGNGNYLVNGKKDIELCLKFSFLSFYRKMKHLYSHLHINYYFDCPVKK